jgi:phosphatidylglycerophosphatase A
MVSVLGAMIVAGGVASVMLSQGAIEATGKKDPHEVVTDELAGQAVCYLAILLCPSDPWPAQKAWAIAVVGFLFFRIFDILKPWPARQLERLPAGWGILADDLMAGLYAGACLWLGMLLW